MDAQTIAFAGVAATLVAIPGADFAVVFRNSLLRQGSGLFTSAGTVSGLLVHTTAAAAGLAAIVMASAVAFTVIKVVGAAYLTFLGVRTLWSSWRTRGRPEQSTQAGEAPPGQATRSAAMVTPARAYRQGLLTNVLNPKAPVIFLSLLPQFIPADAPVVPRTLLLSGILVLIAAVWYPVLALAVGRLGQLLRQPRVRRWIDAVAGTILVALGIRLLLEHRPTGATP